MTRGEPRETKSPVNSWVMEGMQVMQYVMKCSICYGKTILGYNIFVDLMHSIVDENVWNLFVMGFEQRIN